MSIVIKAISQEEVASIFKSNADSVFGIIEDSFRKYLAGDIIMPDKISQIFDEESQNRINCMPATLIAEKICGMKWVSVFPSNASKGVQNVTGIMLLSELETGFPIAVIDGTLSTKMRTAAVGCTAAKYLAPSKVETIGIIGAGEEARMHFTLLKHMFPSIKECRVCSLNTEIEQGFIDKFKTIVPEVKFISCNNDSHLCASGADIIVTAISGQCPVLKAADITKGGLYIHVGGWEDEYGVAQKADKIVCDTLGLSTYESMYRADAVYHLKSMVVVTTGFHVARGVYDARGFGIDAEGVEAINTGYVIKPYNYCREFVARGKDLIYMIFKPSHDFIGSVL